MASRTFNDVGLITLGKKTANGNIYPVEEVSKFQPGSPLWSRMVANNLIGELGCPTKDPNQTPEEYTERLKNG